MNVYVYITFKRALVSLLQLSAVCNECRWNAFLFWFGRYPVCLPALRTLFYCTGVNLNKLCNFRDGAEGPSKQGLRASLAIELLF
jgi:hypothetical protein